MIFQGKAVSVALQADGIAELTLDLAGEPVNKLDRLTLDELRQALDALKATAGVRALLIASAKPLFVVGADITEFSAAFRRSEAQVLESILAVDRLFCDLEDLPIPSAVAINGLALGGGFELCLAADLRVLGEHARVGFPEVGLGLFPGYGGSVRTPRLAGLDVALEWIGSGREVDAASALAAGIVDAVVPEAELVGRCRALLGQALAGEIDYQARRQRKRAALELPAEAAGTLIEQALQAIPAKTRRHFPAASRAFESMAASLALPREQALQREARDFVALARSPQAASLIGLFLNRQAVRKAARGHEALARPVRRCAVLGAGIMGGSIASLAALHGYPCVMKDIREQALRLGMEEGEALLGKRVARQAMSEAQRQECLARIQPTLDYTPFAEVDLVVEAVVENPEIKQAVLAETECTLPAEAILTTNTSTISVNLLARALQRPQNFCGMHFFNPVQQMPLVEVIRGEQSSAQTIATAVALAVRLGKTPIVVNDCPGFLVNRILFAYLGGFVRLLHEGVDFPRIDRVMEAFGWPMGPAYLLDVIGLDTSRHCMEVLAAGYPTRMRHDFRDAVATLHDAGRLGQKNRQGFYRYTADASGRLLREDDPQVAALLAAPAAASMDDAQIVARMMVPLCLEAVRSLEEGIVASAAEVDMGAVLGISFPGSHGGPLRYIDTLGVRRFVALADGLAGLGELYRVTDGLRQMADEDRGFY